MVVTQDYNTTYSHPAYTAGLQKSQKRKVSFPSTADMKWRPNRGPSGRERKLCVLGGSARAVRSAPMTLVSFAESPALEANISLQVGLKRNPELRGICHVPGQRLSILT